MNRARRVSAAVVAVVAFVLTSSSAVGATKIEQPSQSPYAVALDANGKPQSFTIAASGFPAGHLVFIEQCDGRQPTEDKWSPALDCDVGNAPAPVLVDANGVATFDAADVNHAFQPVRGESPSQLFNCLAPNEKAPKNGLASYETCQVRISTNNTTITGDQAFLPITFGNAEGDASGSSTVLAPVLVGAALLVLIAGGFWWTRSRRADTSRTR